PEIVRRAANASPSRQKSNPFPAPAPGWPVLPPPPRGPPRGLPSIVSPVRAQLSSLPPASDLFPGPLLIFFTSLPPYFLRLLERIQRRLPGRARLPPFVHPEPLIRKLSRILLEHLHKPRGVRHHVRLRVPGPHQFERRIELQMVAPLRLAPVHVPRHHRAVRAQRDPCHPAGCARRNAEERHEHSLLERAVHVHQHAHVSVLPQHAQHLPHRFVLVDRAVPTQRAVPIHQRIHPPVFQRPHQEVQGMAVQRLRKRRQFPRPHVPGQINQPFAPRLRRQVVLHPVNRDDSPDTLRRVPRELRKFSAHPSDVAHQPEPRGASLPLRHFRERQLQIEQRRALQPRIHTVEHRGHTRTHRSRHPPRQHAHRMEHAPCGNIFQPFTHRRHSPTSGHLCPGPRRNHTPGPLGRSFDRLVPPCRFRLHCAAPPPRSFSPRSSSSVFSPASVP